MALNIKLLKEICETPGAPGFESRIREIAFRELKDLADEVSIDNMGNLICLMKGRGSKKIMAAAHMDEIGFIVTDIDDLGFVRFHTLGGFDPKTLTAQRVIIHGKKDIMGVMGSRSVHMMSAAEKSKAPEIKDYFIDLGMKKKDVIKIVSVGDSITRERELVEMGSCVNCKSIDNRVSVFILIETFKKLKNPPQNFYAVFTVQEEVGLRGASLAAHKIDPDFGFGLDTTVAQDLPGIQSHERVTSLGEGAAIKIMDSSAICDRRMVDFMKKTAEKNKIKWQPEVLPVGGTDTAGIQRMGKTGAITGAISIPTRHLHQVVEMADKQDIMSAIELLQHCVLDINKHNWEVN